MSKKVFMFSIGILIIGIVGLGFILLEKRQDSSSTPSQPKTKRYDKFHMTGIQYTHTRDNQVLFIISFDEITHQKKRVGPLTINPVKEIEMTNVRIRVNQAVSVDQTDEVGQQWGTLFPVSLDEMFQETLQGQQLGFISQVLVHGMEVIVLRAGQEQLRMTASKVSLRLHAGKVRFEGGFALASQRSQQLITKKAEWRDDHKALFIPGAYVLRNEDGEHHGSQALFAIDHIGRIIKINGSATTRKKSVTK